MPDMESPLTHSIGLSGVIRWLIAAAAVIAVAAAFADHHYALGITATVFIVGATALGVFGWRRQLPQ